MTHYFLFAGEASGDLHGSQLIQALQAKNSSFCGVGGPRMRKENFKCLIPMEDFQVMGFSDVLGALPRLIKRFYQVRHAILTLKPACVILIDYPGFNLRLACSLRKAGFQGKLVQYICPTVWAHGKKRIEVLNTYYDLLLTIFPFEKDYFKQTQLKVEYIGNPLIETIDHYPYQTDWHHQWGCSQEIIALFPGSRLGEIKKHLPQQLEVATQLKFRYSHLQFAVACAQDSLQPIISELIQKSALRINQDIYLIPPHDHYHLMKYCKLAIAKLGTVTLELACHEVPSVVHYEVSTLNYLIAKYFLKLKLPHYCIVNILGKQTIFPEFIGRKLIPIHLRKELESLYMHPQKYQHIQDACKQLKKELGHHSSYQYAAKIIDELMHAEKL